MSGWTANAFTRVCRVKVDFGDDIGNTKQIEATGFWVGEGETVHFITNRHNLDPTLKEGPETSLELRTVSIELREWKQHSMRPETRFFHVSNLERALRVHRTADVAALINPQFTEPTDGFPRLGFPASLIAPPAFFHKIMPMDVASFIGFPGKTGRPWYDELWKLPIARTVNIASWPQEPFSNRSIPTSDVTLVAGLSFAGSSGSPLLFHEKGIHLTSDSAVQITGHIPPMIIGIMSGHWWGDEDQSNSMFFHSGLSYFTRSPTMLGLLDLT